MTVLCGSLMLAACGSTPLSLRDSSAPVYSARAVVRFGATQRSGLEADYAQVQGSGTQRLDANQIVSIGADSIAGPATLQNEARVQYAHIAYNHLLFADRPVQMEWFAGLAHLRVKWETAAATAAGPQRLSKGTDWLGPGGGIAARWRISDPLALEGRWSAAIDFPANSNGSRTQAELAFALRPGAGVSLRAGYAVTSAEVDDLSSDSRLAFRARGPFLGLALEFR